MHQRLVHAREIFWATPANDVVIIGECCQFLGQFNWRKLDCLIAKKKGSGIGLAMTFRIVQLHNGKIDFFSEPGKGTTFVIRFPVQGSS